jgi:hypothetical protein
MNRSQLDNIKERLDIEATASQRIEMLQFLVGLTKRDFDNIGSFASNVYVNPTPTLGVGDVVVGSSASNVYVNPTPTLGVGDVVECVEEYGCFQKAKSVP